ncbi:helix-turn-helix transcriptional regulator [Paraglaciecola sp. T6c]|uniref:helix-turn-helix transcriptional regulator n=1 Tax=Pseudoalteromonas atlantica (strain T6c / ATCC BAA-1087) TaxID=3042615 RepID=UPI00059F4EDF|nr:helix-turn-helix transcriptional regulator [Paraglaciecola sp. T6c]
MNTGDLVRLVRGHNGLSQTDFAKKIGASRSSVNQWENNYHKPKLENVLTIIEHFKPKQSLCDRLLASVGHFSDDTFGLLSSNSLLKNQIESASSKSSIDSEKVTSEVVNALFDMVIAGEITFRKGADPKVTAEHIYRKLVSSGSIELASNAVYLTPEENASLNLKQR